MSKFYSPLRYPGGKNKLSAFIAKICIDNNINGHYVEPYSGGASVALFLLLEGFVNKITINDKDRAIYAFGIVCLIRQRIFVIKSKGLKSQLQSGENKRNSNQKRKS